MLSTDCCGNTQMHIAVDAEASASANQTATQSDIQRLVHHIKQRDERIAHAENELRKMTEMVAKLREEILPLYRLVKEKAPLPTPSSGRAPMQDIPPLPTPVGYSSEPTTSRERDRDRDRREEREQRDRDRDQVIDPPIQAPPTGGILARKFSTKRLFLGAPKNKSPTHQTYQEKSEYDNPPLATLQNGNSYQSTQSTLSSNSYNILPPGINILPPNMNTNLPSPKSPSNMQHNLNHQHSSATLNPNQSRQPPYRNNSNTMSYATQNEIQPEPSANQNASSSSSSQPTAEIFKSFRVSMDDPCYKVLPAALKRYNIQADWRQYALYIVYGDQERCLELDERPLILFKQLDREGRKPMFMLRRNATATDGISLPPGGII